MKTFYIIIIYPGMYQKEYKITGNMEIGPQHYKIIDEDNQLYYFPIAITMITTKTNSL